MKKIFTLVIIGSGILAAGCKKDAIAIDPSKLCSVENEKKYVVTTGYLDDRGSTFCSNIGGGPVRCMLDVVGNPGDKKIFAADIVQGSGFSEIEELPSGYKSTDIKVHDSNGSIIKLSDKISLTGEMSIAPDGSVCFMEVDKIEK